MTSVIHENGSKEAPKCKTKFFWLTISKTVNRKVNSTKRMVQNYHKTPSSHLSDEC